MIFIIYHPCFNLTNIYFSNILSNTNKLIMEVVKLYQNSAVLQLVHKITVSVEKVTFNSKLKY